MKKLSENELAEVKGGLVNNPLDHSVNFIFVTGFTSKRKHNLIKWLFHIK